MWALLSPFSGGTHATQPRGAGKATPSLEPPMASFYFCGLGGGAMGATAPISVSEGPGIALHYIGGASLNAAVAPWGRSTRPTNPQPVRGLPCHFAKWPTVE